MNEFNDQIALLNLLGFKSLTTVEYFFKFAENIGKSVRDIAPDDKDEYQRALRYFKLLSTGTKSESGLGLFTTEEVTRVEEIEGRYKKIKAIRFTNEGTALYYKLTS